MSDIIQVAKARRAQLAAELARIDEFLRMADELLRMHGAITDQGAEKITVRANGNAPEIVAREPSAEAAAPADLRPAADATEPTEAAWADVMVGRRLRQRRWMMGLTQKQLARLIGVEPRQIQSYEEGRVHISTSRMWRIAGVLEVPMSYFFEEEGEVASPATASPTTRPARSNGSDAAAPIELKAVNGS